eukprot:jgi/Botrbrau1/1396/Bobra.0063s0096.1
MFLSRPRARVCVCVCVCVCVWCVCVRARARARAATGLRISHSYTERKAVSPHIPIPDSSSFSQKLVTRETCGSGLQYDQLSLVVKCS